MTAMDAAVCAAGAARGLSDPTTIETLRPAVVAAVHAFLAACGQSPSDTSVKAAHSGSSIPPQEEE